MVQADVTKVLHDDRCQCPTCYVVKQREVTKEEQRKIWRDVAVRLSLGEGA